MAGEVKLTVSIFVSCNGARVAGRGLIEILEAIRDTGSIRLASEKLGINYKRVWSRLRRAEKILGFKLVETGHSGSRLTAEAEVLIEQYHRLEKILASIGVLSGLSTGLRCS